MHVPKAKKAVAALAAIAGFAVLPATALAAPGSVSATASPGGFLGCAQTNQLQAGFAGGTSQIAWSPNVGLFSPGTLFNESGINALLAQEGIPGRVSAPSGILTLTTVAGGHC
jgi:hypothetical protein